MTKSTNQENDSQLSKSPSREVRIIKEELHHKIAIIRGVMLVLCTIGLICVYPSAKIFAQAPGDANDDGVINILDVTATLNDILGIAQAPGNADCNNDGNVNVLDVTCVLNIILGNSPVPNPTPTPTATPVPLDGAGLYGANCAGCHGIDGSGGSTGVNVQGAIPSEIQDAIDTNAGGMGFLSTLTPEEVQAIATFLLTPVH